MTVQLNHTILRAHDKHETARFIVDILGLPEPSTYGPFLVIELENGVSLDVANASDVGEVHPQHYAFLVSEQDFDDIFGRIQERGLTYCADPFGGRKGEINHNDGGRGVYWDDPNGHILEIITRPYGSGSGEEGEQGSG